jgi:hypothetical protein
MTNAQPSNRSLEDIRTEFSIYLDNTKVETDSVFIGFKKADSVHIYAKLNDEFTTWLKPNKVYSMYITHPGYNAQSLSIVTSNKPDSIKIEVRLSRTEPNCYIGYYKYNKLLKKYTNYE